MECFSGDPLYCQLIPDQETRNRLLPELFECDLTEFFETCEIFAESPDMNALLVVSDESEPYNPLTFYLAEAWAGLRTDEYLIKEDPSLKTLWNFVKRAGLSWMGIRSDRFMKKRTRRSLAGTLWTEKAATPFRD